MIGGALSIAAAGAKLAAELAEKSKNGQLIDAGKAAGLSDMLAQLNLRLQEFEDAANRVDRDGSFARRVLDQYTIDD